MIQRIRRSFHKRSIVDCNFKKWKNPSVRGRPEFFTMLMNGESIVQLFVRKNKDDKISKEFYYLAG